MPSRTIATLVVVLEATRPEAGCFAASLAGVDRVVISRGADRRVERRGAELTLELPDRRISRPHAALARAEGGFVLSDLGSSNGTFLGTGPDEAPATRALLAFEQTFRVGHSVLAVLHDGGPVLERARTGSPWPFATLSAPFARELSRLERVAASRLPLLLLGETGTGKEVLARAVHDRSGRPGPFVAVNCGALPANLVEGQLFGHLKGAFSGALRDEAGFVRAADHGTLFLDEIGDLAPSAQASLLRVLQEGEVTPVGAFRPVKVDVRVVSATHHRLPERVAAGAFRADLFARLSGFSFHVPPLRERRLDVGELLASFCRGAEAARSVRLDAALALLAYEYPLNVRELKQAIDAASVLTEDGAIHLADLPPSIARARALAPGPGRSDHPTPSSTIEPAGHDGGSARRSAELCPQTPGASPLPGGGRSGAPLDQADAALREELAARLHASGHNLTQVAREMGKARQQVQRWVKRFGLKGR